MFVDAQNGFTRDMGSIPITSTIFRFTKINYMKGDPNRQSVGFAVVKDTNMERNYPIKLGNNKLVLYFEDGFKEFMIPEHVRQTYNKIAMSNGKVYLNGYMFDPKTKQWSRSFRSLLIGLFI